MCKPAAPLFLTFGHSQCTQAVWTFHRNSKWHFWWLDIKSAQNNSVVPKRLAEKEKQSTKIKVHNFKCANLPVLSYLHLVIASVLERFTIAIRMRNGTSDGLTLILHKKQPGRAEKTGWKGLVLQKSIGNEKENSTPLQVAAVLCTGSLLQAKAMCKDKSAQLKCTNLPVLFSFEPKPGCAIWLVEKTEQQGFPPELHKGNRLGMENEWEQRPHADLNRDRWIQSPEC